jgi:1-acyl-sn-glycerol-3-phosphate acyltransferase
MSRFILFVRSLLFVVIMTIVTIPWACICFICLPLPYAARYTITSRWNVFMIWLAKVLRSARHA